MNKIRRYSINARREIRAITTYVTGSSTSSVRYWSKMGRLMLQLAGRDLKISLAERACMQLAEGGVVTSLILSMVLTISLLVWGWHRQTCPGLYASNSSISILNYHPTARLCEASSTGKEVTLTNRRHMCSFRTHKGKHHFYNQNSGICIRNICIFYTL